MPQDDYGFLDLRYWEDRVRVALACRDCDGMPRAPNAGQFGTYKDTDVQIMHNGLKVLKDAYYGGPMSTIIHFLKGIHEPQEEKVFAEILPYMPSGAIMVELGSFWAYYSLWFNKTVPGARNFCVEPDAGHLEVGIRNFLLNDAEAVFMQAGVIHSQATLTEESLKNNGTSIFLPMDGRISNNFEHLKNFRRAIPAITLESFMKDQQLDYIDLLHVDIQLAEHHLLQTGAPIFKDRRVGYIFVSTHAMSQDWYTPNYDKYHYECLKMLRDDYGYHIVAEHAVSDSYSGDGLIVAKAPGLVGPDHVKLSKLSDSQFAMKLSG